MLFFGWICYSRETHCLILDIKVKDKDMHERGEIETCSVNLEHSFINFFL